MFKSLSFDVTTVGRIEVKIVFIFLARPFFYQKEIFRKLFVFLDTETQSFNTTEYFFSIIKEAVNVKLEWMHYYLYTFGY